MSPISKLCQAFLMISPHLPRATPMAQCSGTMVPRRNVGLTSYSQRQNCAFLPQSQETRTTSTGIRVIQRHGMALDTIVPRSNPSAFMDHSPTPKHNLFIPSLLLAAPFS